MTRLRDKRDEKYDDGEAAYDLSAHDLDAHTLGLPDGSVFTVHAREGGEALAGLGGWRFFYKFGWKPTTDRDRAGLAAMKQALIDNGFATGIDLTQMVFGNAATNRTVEFQRAQGLTDDGVIGPRTARRLFEFYFAKAEAKYGIPEHLLAKIACGESNDDPIAEGVTDPDDEGLLQFHLPFWPGLTLADVWDPKTVVALASEKLASLRRITGSWKGAAVAWNIGATYAKAWVAAGYPAKGGQIMGTDPAGNPIFAYERATAYWNYIEPLPYR